MRKTLLFVIFGILLTSLASAEILISEQPNEIYNFGETINVPIIIKSLTGVTGSFEMFLICGGNEINFYKNGINLKAGQEKRIDASLILTPQMTAGLKGKCVIKSILGAEYVLTNEFSISDLINLQVSADKSQIDPGESIVIEGNAEKLSEAPVNGFAEIDVLPENANANTTPITSKVETINNGYLEGNITIKDKTAAGNYIIKIKAYEKDPLGTTTNQGENKLIFSVNQIPTNLEVMIENPEVEPGTPLKAKVILHDQTGLNIPETATIKIQNSDEKLLDKFDVETGETFEFQTEYNSAPQDYTVLAQSAEIKNGAEFKILEKKDIQIQVANRTLTIVNKGNVDYCNKTILVKISNQALNLNPCIGVDEEKKYALSAPDGQYEISVIADETEYKQNAVLTGKAIDIKEAGAGVVTLTRQPFVWIFVVAILGFVVFNIYKKGFKRSFVGYIHKRKSKTPKTITPEKTKEKVQSTSLSTNKLFQVNPAELCLSIKGERQNATVLNLRIKNYSEVKQNFQGVEEAISKISQLIRNEKANVYENQENIFIIFAPIRTRTFKNEKIALKFAQEIKEILTHHNRLFKQKIKYGIAINTGIIIANQKDDRIQFMSMGDLMTQSKKISMLSNETILLGEKIREKLGNDVKVEKFTRDKLNVYAIKEIKESKDNEKFIRSFLERIDKK